VSGLAQREGLSHVRPQGAGDRELGHLPQVALVRAQRCLDATHDLEEEGVDSWIAGAVVHGLAYKAVFDVLTEDGCDLVEGGCLRLEAA